MRALRAHERGGPEQLVEEESPMPSPGIGDVLVRVQAASFTPPELDWPSTWVDRAGRDRRPSIPGREVAGEARNVARKPDRLDHRTAAVVPMAALTSQQALFDHGGVASGQTVAVLGAGGGVGTFAVQLARAAGARVVAVARPWATAVLRALGAEIFVDLESAPLSKVDLVFDLVGGEMLRRACAVARPGATVVSVVEAPPVDVNRRGLIFVVEPNRAQLQELGARIVAGELRPVVGGPWPLKEGRAAFAPKPR